MNEELANEFILSMNRLSEQTTGIMSQLHVMTDLLQCIGGAIVGLLIALAVIRGLKL